MKTIGILLDAARLSFSLRELVEDIARFESRKNRASPESALREFGRRARELLGLPADSFTERASTSQAESEWLMSDGTIQTLTEDQASHLRLRKMMVTSDPPPYSAAPVGRCSLDELREDERIWANFWNTNPQNSEFKRHLESVRAAIARAEARLSPEGNFHG